MGNIFYLFLEQPLINILFLLYVLIPGHDFGVAVILLTVLIRAILWPLTHKQLHSQRKLSKLQPEIKKITEKYKGNPQEQQKALLELYREKEVNPGMSCLLTLIQMPILFALFYVFRDFGNDAYVQLSNNNGLLKDIYGFINNWQLVKNFIILNPVVDARFLGLVNLAKPSVALALTAGILQFFQARMLMPKRKTKEPDMAAAISAQMVYFMPLMITIFALQFPSVLPFYWSLTTIIAFIQQKIVMSSEVEEMEREAEEGKIVLNPPQKRPKRKR